MNQAIIIGNLTRDPDLRSTQSGISVCTFTVAVSRKYGKNEADYLPVVAWRTLADNCAKYLHKGSQVAVSGAIQTRSYKANGQKRYVTEIIADEVKFLNNKRPGPEDDDIPPGFLEITDDDDLPF